MMTTDELPRPKPGVLFQPVEDGAILLHVEEEVYFGLNSVGARIWSLLPPTSASLSEVHGSLAEEYPDVDASTLEADVQELIESLREAGLVV